MDAEPLRDDLKLAGSQLVEHLDELGMKPEGAAWFYFHDLDDWRFYIASSLVDLEGKTRVYRQLVDALSSFKHVDGLSVFDIHLASPHDTLFQVMKMNFHVSGGGALSIRNSTVNGLLVDAFIYRWDDRPRAGRELKMAASRFKKNAEKARERT